MKFITLFYSRNWFSLIKTKWNKITAIWIFCVGWKFWQEANIDSLKLQLSYEFRGKCRVSKNVLARDACSCDRKQTQFLKTWFFCATHDTSLCYIHAEKNCAQWCWLQFVFLLELGLALKHPNRCSQSLPLPVARKQHGTSSIQLFATGRFQSIMPALQFLMMFQLKSCTDVKCFWLTAVKCWSCCMIFERTKNLIKK